ncbi:MAG TPA: hypothetical protein DCY13_08310, partial [Verrucomicrobiales bacterium]|nr:hypothetical protein [Verrucomicrobiales bacterium]
GHVAQVLPRFDWRVNWDRGEIVVHAQDRPVKTLLWQAANPKTRDFRLETIGSTWTSTEQTLDTDGRLTVR